MVPGGADGVLALVGPVKSRTSSRAARRTDKHHRVTLVGLDAPVKLWIKHHAALDDLARQRLPLRPDYFLAPES